jgi:hypothetical protein
MSNDDEYLDADDGDIEVDLDEYPPEKTPKKPRKTKEVKDYLKTHKKDKTYKRVLAASKKHPGASLYELQHGVGSKASKAYRARQRPGTVGVDHAAIHKAFKDSGYKVLKDGDYAKSPITGVHGSKVVMYGGTFVYDPKKDKGHHYDRVTEELLAQVESRLHKPGRKR